MQLNALLGETRLIAGPGRLDAPTMLPPLEFGNVRPVELRVWDKTQHGDLAAVDLADYQITLLVGPPNVRPSLGFWQVTTAVGVSSAIPARASADDVRKGLASAFGVVSVRGGNGSYVVTLEQAGAWALPTATFSGNTLSNVLIFESTPGTATSPAQYRIEVLEVAPARIVPAGWTAGDTNPVNTFDQVNGRLWRLKLSPDADNGFFTLIVDGVETRFINFDGGAYQITLALAAAGKTAQVEPDGTGGFWVCFMMDVAEASVGGNLVILPYAKGALDLTSTGIRELLDGLQFAPVKLSVILTKNGQTVTVASADVMLQMPVNQPATLTIDAPEMAGMSFAISEDKAFLHVYINGIWQYDIPLNAPA